MFKNVAWFSNFLCFLLITTITFASDSLTTNFQFSENNFTQKIHSYAEMQSILNKVSVHPFINVSETGFSSQGRSLYLVKLNRNPGYTKWKVFLFAQQHGNEPAGKEALIALLKNIAKNPELLPEDVALWVMPMVNPDGAESNQRRNRNGADLNRDHIILQQPETQTLHKVFREFMPHISIDCHEFTRDSKDYSEQGWLEWPQIMMDCLNNPFFDTEIYKSGLRWLEQVAPALQKKGYNYCRYFVGGGPPMNEQRYSTPEMDDARNGLGAYGGLSFIIESGVKRNSANPNEDLYKRVDAYLQIFYQFLQNNKFREEDINTIRKSRNRAMPGFIPTNYFWGSTGIQTTEFKVIDAISGEVKIIPTANFMHHMIVKKTIPLPKAYIIDADKAEVFIKLLQHHAIPFDTLKKEIKVFVEPVRILRIETEWDPVYARYGGRQISEIDSITQKNFPAGSLLIQLQNETAVRAALLLEPSAIYGLYQYVPFKNFLSEKGFTPVWRIIE